MVPFKQLQDYKMVLDAHHKKITSFFLFNESGDMPDSSLETLSIKTLTDLYSNLSKMFKDNNLIE